jgi:adenylate cyclase
MAEHDATQEWVEEIWRTYLTTGYPPDDMELPWFMGPTFRPWLGRLPSNPRCQLCAAPFGGAGGTLVRLTLRLAPSRLNPRICDLCDRFIQEHQGGAEVDVTVLFADVRGSTRIAQTMRPAEFSQLINRFFVTASDVLHRHHGLVEKLIGDEVTAFFVSGTAGPNHQRAALEAAQDILRATGHGSEKAPWVPVGIGVHSGTAYVGAVGKANRGAAEIVVLGDVPNTGARLAGAAAPGEILASGVTIARAGWDCAGLEQRELELKGHDAPLSAWVLTPTTSLSSA